MLGLKMEMTDTPTPLPSLFGVASITPGELAGGAVAETVAVDAPALCVTVTVSLTPDAVTHWPIFATSEVTYGCEFGSGNLEKDSTEVVRKDEVDPALRSEDVELNPSRRSDEIEVDPSRRSEAVVVASAPRPEEVVVDPSRSSEEVDSVPRSEEVEMEPSRLSEEVNVDSGPRSEEVEIEPSRLSDEVGVDPSRRSEEVEIDPSRRSEEVDGIGELVGVIRVCRVEASGAPGRPGVGSAPLSEEIGERMAEDVSKAGGGGTSVSKAGGMGDLADPGARSVGVMFIDIVVLEPSTGRSPEFPPPISWPRKLRITLGVSRLAISYGGGRGQKSVNGERPHSEDPGHVLRECRRPLPDIEIKCCKRSDASDDCENGPAAHQKVESADNIHDASE
ncbi:hypothetical protein NLG97_g5766 [Lecanicillium saksenae]|uniref:Uncharacterized protein n=1 Tax=Lecanicillium saksenae TaxID=468837 RepID=A0ACC1QRI3_9HYPO|nr:hypothetical protein NLG97_g5766 [Lecanicillium saksenae]